MLYWFAIRTEHKYNISMKNICNIPESEFNMTNLLSLRYDEERGIIKVYNIRGKLILEENGKRSFLNN